jgi:hypothetical protein
MTKKKEEIKKQFYDIKLEVLVPTTFTFRVEAENEDKAVENINKLKPKNIKPDYNKKINLKASVYQAGTHMLKLTKVLKK